MPKAQREQTECTDNYHLILQWCRNPQQRMYEGIRPITLFGIPSAERAEETGIAESTLGRAAAAFTVCRDPQARKALHGDDSLTCPRLEHFDDCPLFRRVATNRLRHSLEGWLWHLATRLSDYAPRKPRKKSRYTQLPLIGGV